MDHPRSRGEYSRRKRGFAVFHGSSPLSRGIRAPLRVRVPPPGIIPALAGNTRRDRSSPYADQDHPRSRGEYRLCSTTICSGRGSSPLSRGILAGVIPSQVRARIIPALAGNTSLQSRRTRSTRDHPRSRGEYTASRTGMVATEGSSPLSRGIPIRAGCRRTAPGIIPALAGNTWTRSSSSAGTFGSSPLSRGIHLLTRDFISRTCRILGTPSSHVSASRSHSPRVCDGHPPGGVGRLARHLKDLDGPSGSAPRSRLVPMDHPMSGRTYLARS